MTSFFALVIMFTLNLALLPHDVKKSPIEASKGRSRPPPVPNVMILGPDLGDPDSTQVSVQDTLSTSTE